MKKLKHFTCCRCLKVKPFEDAWCEYFDQDKPQRWWCDECEDSSEKHNRFSDNKEVKCKEEK